jgi:hypothetical protein
MNRRFFPGVLICVVALAACEPSNPRPQPKPGGWHPPPPIDQPTGPGQEPTGPPSEQPKEEPRPAPNPVPPPTDTKPPGELPYAKAVPGKPGFVTSPYDPYKGYIDVRGFPPGTEVKDPYSGKTFLVPPF